MYKYEWNFISGDTWHDFVLIFFYVYYTINVCAELDTESIILNIKTYIFINEDDGYVITNIMYKRGCIYA